MNWQRTVEIITLVIASTRSGVGNLSIYGSDLSSRSANKRCSRVDRSVRRLARRKCYRVGIHSNILDGEGPIGDEVGGNILIVDLTRVKRTIGRACHIGMISSENRW